MKPTPKELEVLRAIIKSEFQDGNDPVNNPVWSWSCNPFAKKSSLGGVVASLKKKGLVTQGGEGDDATLSITQRGFEAAQG